MHIMLRWRQQASLKGIIKDITCPTYVLVIGTSFYLTLLCFGRHSSGSKSAEKSKDKMKSPKSRDLDDKMDDDDSDEMHLRGKGISYSCETHCVCFTCKFSCIYLWLCRSVSLSSKTHHVSQMENADSNCGLSVSIHPEQHPLQMLYHSVLNYQSYNVLPILSLCLQAQEEREQDGYQQRELG